MTSKEMTKACKAFRISHGYTQSSIADELHYTPQNIGNFERGKNDSLSIFMWYVNHGFTTEYAKEYIDSLKGGSMK